MSCQFNPCSYHWMKNADVSNRILKNYFSCHNSCQLYVHVKLKKKKTKLKYAHVRLDSSHQMVLKLKSLKVSPSLQYHLHSCRYTNLSKVKGLVWYVCLNTYFQFLNTNIIRIFIHCLTYTYFQKIQTMLLKQYY